MIFQKPTMPVIRISKVKALIVYVIVLVIAYYFMLPPLNWHSPAFWSFFTPAILILLVILTMFSSQGVQAPKKPVVIFGLVLILAPSLLGIMGIRLFHFPCYEHHNVPKVLDT